MLIKRKLKIFLDIIITYKKKEKELEDKDKELTLMNDMLDDNINKIKEITKAYLKSKYGNRYAFDNDEDITNSFKNIIKDYKISYNPKK